MIRIILIVLVVCLVCVPPAQARVMQGGDDAPITCGIWTYYARGVMDRVRRVRGLDACEDCAGMAATVDQRHIGQRIEVWYNGAWRGVFQVVDVGNGRNREGLVGEVDFETAQQWGMRGPVWGCYRRAEWSQK